ncbi:MAG: MFS transporter, partial [Paludibacter sp.]|nr:MFS transporter [Paludibacter sp.]
MQKKTSPWSWIPSLYLAEGLPYVAVMTISVIMYKRMGISNTDIALYTSWLYLPWVIKPFWSPFVDLLKTKRWWIVTMQLFIGAGFAGIAFMIPVPFFFQATLAFFWLLAFSSATHDIAADGFYMLALDSNNQAKFVGIRSTFYRIATIMGQGVLIILAGFLETATGMEPLKFKVDAMPDYNQTSMLIEPARDVQPLEGDLRFVTGNQTVQIGVSGLDKDSLQVFLSTVEALNRQNGFIEVEQAAANQQTGKKESWWTSYVSQPLGYWIKNTFGEKRKEVEELVLAGNVGITSVWLSKSPEPGEQIILNTSLSR